MTRNVSRFIALLLILAYAAGCKNSSSGRDSDGTQQEDLAAQSIEIVPARSTLAIDQHRRLRLIAGYPDGTSHDVTEYAQWASSDDSVVSIGNSTENKGVIQGLSLGTATISATYEGLTDDAEVSVIEGDQDPMEDDARIILLHHSTGGRIWSGGVPAWFSEYNSTHGSSHSIIEQSFPKDTPYGWNNYPYDYWKIWVDNAGYDPYLEEPTLEMLTQDYDVIVWKHCYPVSDIQPDTGSPSISSSTKKIENYKLQYEALKNKMREFPQTRFIVWTGAALVQGATTEDKGRRARAFFEWVKNEWDEPGDNIYIWDFFELETEGGFYLKNEYAEGVNNSHPNSDFSRRVALHLCNRIIDVIEGNGDIGSLTGI